MTAIKQFRQTFVNQILILVTSGHGSVRVTTPCISKSNILQITTHCSISNFVCKIRYTPLMKVDKYCYLGIYLQNKLSWTFIVTIIMLHKANCLLGCLKWNLKSSPRYFKEYAYKKLVLLSIEYCCSIWDPYQ